MRLGNLLREFDVTSRNLRLPTGQAKGYERDAFADAWARYCPEDPGTKPSQPSQPSQCRSGAGRLFGWDGLSRPSGVVPSGLCWLVRGGMGRLKPYRPQMPSRG